MKVLHFAYKWVCDHFKGNPGKPREKGGQKVGATNVPPAKGPPLFFGAADLWKGGPLARATQST